MVVPRWDELHIFLNNLKWWKRCDNVEYCGKVDAENKEAIQLFCNDVSNLKSVIDPSDQRDRSEPKEVVIESKESHIMSSGDIMWWKVCEMGFGTEYDWRIDAEVKWSGLWRMMESGERIEDASIFMVMLEAVTRQGLEQDIKE